MECFSSVPVPSVKFFGDGCPPFSWFTQVWVFFTYDLNQNPAYRWEGSVSQKKTVFASSDSTTAKTFLQSIVSAK